MRKRAQFVIFILVMTEWGMGTNFPFENKTIYGKWSNYCPDKLNVASDSSIMFTNDKEGHLEAQMESFTERSMWNCSVASLPSEDMMINGFYQKYSFLEIPEDSGLFWSLYCETFSDSTILAEKAMNITTMVLNGGFLMNFKEEGECATFFSEEKEFNLSSFTFKKADPAPCQCNSICFEGATRISSFTTPFDNMGKMTLESSRIYGTYLESPNNSLFNAVVECGVVYVPEYPSPLMIVEYCQNGNHSVLNMEFMMTFAGNQSVFISDKTIPTCFSVINSSLILFVSLSFSVGLLLFWVLIH